jgi:hypothetical protein
VHGPKLGNYALSLVAGLIAGTSSVDGVLSAVGQYYQDKMQRVVQQAKQGAKPNAPETIEQKGSSSPLVDHGVLSNSIDYEKGRR